jgi:predicted site-specific integrase-resolvase
MSAKVKPPPTTLISHHDVAEWWSVSPKLLRRWIARGDFPAPHSQAGTYLFYDRAVIEHQLRTGKWPKGTVFYGSGSGDGIEAGG